MRAPAKVSLTPSNATAGIDPVTGRNASTRAYLLLRQAVLAGNFRPNQIITLRMATELLKLGEMPAREALKRLIAEGARAESLHVVPISMSAATGEMLDDLGGRPSSRKPQPPCCCWSTKPPPPISTATI